MKTSKTITILLFLFFQSILAKPILHHGIGFRLTNGGQGIYYELAANMNRLNQVYFNYGFHIEKSQYTLDQYGFTGNNQNNDILIPAVLGFRKVLFDNKMAGTMRPYYFGELGQIGRLTGNKLNSLQLINCSGEWSTGIGIQFRSGRLIHRLHAGFVSNSLIDGNAILNMTLFWK